MTDQDARPSARFTTGVGTGFSTEQGHAFLGVPYAAAPVGDRRFAPPSPPPPWTGERSFTAHGAASLQPEDLVVTMMPGAAPLFLPPGLETSEDCLFLDIWIPGADTDTDGSLPVVVWFHGGGWVTGTAAASWTDGTELAHRERVIVVGINYRLGLLGMLGVSYTDDPEGAGVTNLALLDQIAALRFVRDNIAAVGGDPARVTVIGESAGAFSALALLGAPTAQGLFRAVVAQSGHGGLLHTPAQSAEVTKAILGELGISPGPGALAALRALPARTFLELTERLGIRVVPPVVDGTVLTAGADEAAAAGAARGLVLVVGTDRDESKSFRQLPLGAVDHEVTDEEVDAFLESAPNPPTETSLRSLYSDEGSNLEILDAAGTDRDWRGPVRRFARAADAGGADCYVFEFSWPTEALGGRLGAGHQSEIPFVFGTLSAPGVSTFIGAVADDPTAHAQSRQIQGALGSVARGEQPHFPDGAAWRPFTTGSETVAVIENGNVSQIEGWRGRQLAAWSPAEES